MRRIAILIYDAMRVFDYAVVHEVFGVDRVDSGVPAFDLLRCASSRRPVELEGGTLVRPDAGLAALADADLVIVPGSDRPGEPVLPAVTRALRAAAGKGAMLASLCSGAFTLGAAGLLDGRRATTHWLFLDRLRRMYPAALVQEGPLWTEDGPVHTSAGTAAGIDLCLHLVRKAHGATVAATVARRMVTPPHREGDQAQYVERAIETPTDALGGALAWARERLDQPITVNELARRAHRSPRTFARRFVDVTGTTPLRWLHHQRVLLAQELLERGDLPIEEVARRAGFGTTAVLRRHFSRDLGTTPTAYRSRFAARDVHLPVDPPVAYAL